MGHPAILLMRASLCPTLAANNATRMGHPHSPDYEQQVGPQQDFAAAGCGLMA